MNPEVLSSSVHCPKAEPIILKNMRDVNSPNLFWRSVNDINFTFASEQSHCLGISND